MILTEQEAMTKECRAIPYQLSATMLMSHDGCSAESMRERAVCVASRCMMWRWHDALPTVGHNRGYCGLAGRP